MGKFFFSILLHCLCCCVLCDPCVSLWVFVQCVDSLVCVLCVHHCGEVNLINLWCLFRIICHNWELMLVYSMCCVVLVFFSLHVFLSVVVKGYCFYHEGGSLPLSPARVRLAHHYCNYYQVNKLSIACLFFTQLWVQQGDTMLLSILISFFLKRRPCPAWLRNKMDQSSGQFGSDGKWLLFWLIFGKHT